MKLLRQEQDVPMSLDEAWEFFSSPRNLQKLVPPWMKFQITSLESETMHEGQIIGYRIRLAPLIWSTWITEIVHVEKGREFIDDQRVGPYKLWYHRHTFEEIEGGVRMTDVVHYHVGWGPIGWIAHWLFVDRVVAGIFAHRRKVLEKACEDGTSLFQL